MTAVPFACLPYTLRKCNLWWLKQTTREVHTRRRQEVCATALRRSVVSSLDHQLHQRCNQSASKAYGPMGLKISHCCPPSTMDLGTQIKKNCCEIKHRLLWMQHDVACKASEFGPQSHSLQLGPKQPSWEGGTKGAPACWQITAVSGKEWLKCGSFLDIFSKSFGPNIWSKTADSKHLGHPSAYGRSPSDSRWRYQVL